MSPPPSPLVQELKKLEISHIQSYEENSWYKQKKYYVGYSAVQTKVFIKVCESKETAQYEFLTSKHIWELGDIKSPQPLFCRCMQDISFLVFQMIEDAIPLNKILKKELTNKSRALIAFGISNAIHGLHKANLIHRDFRPHNIMVNKSMEVFIIDFQFLIDKSRKQFEDHSETDKRTLLGLWGPYARGYLWWDDAYSALLIFDELHVDQDHLLNIERVKLKRLVGATQAFGFGSTPFHFAVWCAIFATQLLNFSHKALLYKVLCLFSNKKSILNISLVFKNSFAH